MTSSLVMLMIVVFIIKKSKKNIIDSLREWRLYDSKVNRKQYGVCNACEVFQIAEWSNY